VMKRRQRSTAMLQMMARARAGDSVPRRVTLLPDAKESERCPRYAALHHITRVRCRPAHRRGAI
jgi:hypothetical protein